MELELSYQRYDLDKSTFSQSDSFSDGSSFTFSALYTPEGQLTYTSLMANTIYSPNGTKAQGYLNPYIGIGLGVALIEWNDVSHDSTSYYSDDATAAAGQLLLGNQFSIADSWKLDLAYRYFITQDYSYSDDTEETTVSGNGSHSLLLSMVKQF